MEISNSFGLITGNSIRLYFNNVKATSEKLSSGLQINRAADDPSGMAISTGMKSVIGGLSMAILNAQEGITMLQTTDGAAAEIGDLLQRGRDLAVRAANEATLSDDDLDRIQIEIDSIIDEVDQIANAVTYNTYELLTGGTGLDDTYNIQAEWQSGTYNPADLETDLFPGRIQLQADWTEHPQYNQTMADTNEYRFNIYLVSATDNGNGTYTARLQFDARVSNGDPVCNYTGTISLGAGAATVGSAGVVDMGGGDFDFNINANDVNTNYGFIEFTTSDISSFTFNLSGNSSGNATKLYYGTQQVANAATFSSANSWTAYTATPATFQSNVFDTDQAYGSDGQFNSAVGVPAGSSIQIELFQSADGVGGWTSVGVFGPNDSYSYTERFLYSVVTLTRGPVATTTPLMNSYAIEILENRELQIGTENGKIYRFVIPPWDAQASGLGINGADVTSASEIETFNDAIESLSAIREEIGQLEETLSHIINDLFKIKNNIAAANSSIEDADFARQFTELTRANIMGQSTMAITAQGDAIAKGVINLFGETGVGDGSMRTAKELAGV